MAVEDSRTADADSLRVLFDALGDRRAAVRAIAARALGRFERADFAVRLWPTLRDASPVVRAEGANAVAQIVRAQGARVDGLTGTAVDSLTAGLERERDDEVVGVFARSLGRMVRVDANGERALAAIGREYSRLVASGLSRANAHRLFGVIDGFYWYSRLRRPESDTAMAAPGQELQLLTYGRGAPTALAAQIRRLAVMTLTSPRIAGDSVAALAIADPDAQVRRLAVLAAANVRDAAVRRRVLEQALADHAFIVRFEGVRSWRRFYAGDCGPLVRAASDTNAAVMLAAIDALGGCTDAGAARAVLAPLARDVPSGAARMTGKPSWHAHAHALVALARVARAQARDAVTSAAAHPVWQVRAYAARAAAVLQDTATLYRLATDSSAGVQEAAITGLTTVGPRLADRVAVQAVLSPSYHVALASALALKGGVEDKNAVANLLTALSNLTSERRENSRDARMEVLARIGETRQVDVRAALSPYLQDFDPLVADRAAEIITRSTGTAVHATAHVTRPISPRLGEIASSAARLRITMSPASGGGTFVVRLRTAAAPATAARLIELAERGYYDGLTFHRVEPTFVIQGGSPGATEYIGDGPFMRDELDLASHTYGTVGISTRGRDTGDAQIFVNLTDNFRLDHEYTVVGEIVEGMAVVDRILEGDTMARVRVELVRR